MIVHDYDLEKGIYAFTEYDLYTNLHAHPALEILRAEEGEFTYWSSNNQRIRASAILIPANYLHAIDATGATCRVTMAEPEFVFFNRLIEILDTKDWQSKITVLTLEQANQLCASFFRQELQTTIAAATPDLRVFQCLSHLEKFAHQRRVSLEELAQIVHLSASRISHLFRAKMGVTIQRYQSWCRLKRTVSTFLQEPGDLQSAAWGNGFYDAAHFNRTFREMMGMNPSSVYNSGIVQMEEE